MVAIHCIDQPPMIWFSAPEVSLPNAFPLPEGKLVDTAEVNDVTNIVVGVLVITLNPEAGQGGCSISFPDPSIEKVSGITPGPPQSVGPEESQTLRKALFHRGLETAVITRSFRCVVAGSLPEQW